MTDYKDQLPDVPMAEYCVIQPSPDALWVRILFIDPDDNPLMKFHMSMVDWTKFIASIADKLREMHEHPQDKPVA